MNNSPEKKIWFPAKRYGWGWGLPVCWQGWVVMLSFMLLITVSAILLLPSHPFVWEGVVCILAVMLIGICWWKGETPRWRWGKE